MADELTVYYTNARMNGKTCLLAGPFIDIGYAEACIDIVGPIFIQEDPTAVHATFGVMSCKGHAGFGRYNVQLRANGIPAPVPDN